MYSVAQGFQPLKRLLSRNMQECKTERDPEEYSASTPQRLNNLRHGKSYQASQKKEAPQLKFRMAGLQIKNGEDNSNLLGPLLTCQMWSWSILNVI